MGLAGQFDSWRNECINNSKLQTYLKLETTSCRGLSDIALSTLIS